jgi:hypothetical protein
MKWRGSLVLAAILVCSVALASAGSQGASTILNFGSIQTPAYLSALDASKLQIAKIYPGGGSILAVIEDKMGTLDTKRQILDYAVDRMHVNAVMIGWRRQPVWEGSDSRDQLEIPLNSGKLNPSYIKHLDEWVSLAKEYKVYVVFEEWFSPMRATGRGQWTGFNDSTFQDRWANFYKVLGTYFRGNTSIAGFIPGEEVLADGDSYPYPISGSADFNELWNQVMTKLSKALHEGDPNFNFIAIPTVDWDAGIYTLGSKAIYPNAWQPLNDTNPHVLYRVMSNPRNSIKASTLYPFDDLVWIRDHYGSSLLDGGINWHRETGLPIILECLVEWRATEAGGVWVWDTAGLQWLRDFLAAMKNEGIGLNMGEYWNESEPYGTHDSLGNERTWVQVYSEAAYS